MSDMIWLKHPQLELLVSTSGNISHMNGIKIKQFVDHHDYMYVHFKKKYLVHRLVAQTFIDNPNNCLEVNHKDANRQNNNLENLEWCTHTENIQKAYTETKTVNVHSYSVVQYSLDGQKIKEWTSITEAANSLEIHRSTISRVLRGKNKTAGGFYWKYITEVPNNSKIIQNAEKVKLEKRHLGLGIIQIKKDGTEIKWSSVRNASIKLGVNPSAIHSVLKGMTQTCLESYWKYQDSERTFIRQNTLPESTEPIPGFSKYCISKDAKVYNLSTGRILKPMKDRQSPLMVHLTNDDGKRKACFIHRLVVHTYLKPDVEKYNVYHKNKDIYDNRLENLYVKQHKEKGAETKWSWADDDSA